MRRFLRLKRDRLYVAGSDLHPKDKGQIALFQRLNETKPPRLRSNPFRQRAALEMMKRKWEE